MSSRIPVAYVEIRALAHATEDTDKVQTAVNNTLPTELAESVIIKKTSVTGHHGNPIVLLEVKVDDRNAAQAVLQKLSSGLGLMDKELLSNEIQQHLEKGNLYVRLDKQAAYLNQLKLCKTDPVRFRIHFRKHTHEEVVNLCREFGLIP